MPRLRTVACWFVSLYIVMFMLFFLFVETNISYPSQAYKQHSNYKKGQTYLNKNLVYNKSLSSAQRDKITSYAYLNRLTGNWNKFRTTSKLQHTGKNIYATYKVNTSKFNTSFHCGNVRSWSTLTISESLKTRNITNPHLLESCTRPHFLPAGIKALPKTALASFPGCGNTWARQLIEQVTGIWTGSLYHDPTLREGGLMGEGIHDTSRVAVVKTHWPYVKPSASAVESYERVLLVVRSPQECLLAEYNRRMSKTHTGVASQHDFSGRAWKRFALGHSSLWLHFYRSWIQQDSCTLIIDFSKLKTNLLAELKQIASFLGVRGKGLTERLKCIVKNGTNILFRRKSTPHNFTMFDSDLRRAVTKDGETLRNIIARKAKYDIIFDW